VRSPTLMLSQPMKILRSLVQSSLHLGLLALIIVGSLPARAEPNALSKVPGTAVQISPPEGFQPSQLFLGFEQQQTGASILVTEMPIPKAEVPKLLEQLNSAAVLESKGMRLLESQAIAISGIPGKLLLVSQSNRGVAFLKWVGVAAKGDRVLIVTAPFPKSEAATLKEPLHQSIIGLTWMPSQLVQPLEGLPFTFQPAGDLQLSTRVSNNVILTQNGMKAPVPVSQPFLVMGSAYDAVQIHDLAKFSRMRLKAMLQVRGVTEVSGSSKTISGYPAFEMVARGYDLKTNTPLTLYQVVMATQKTYYIVQGFVPDTKVQTYLPIFRSVADSIVPKL
jgi:hypothetical protein